jgi:hypothetical protein
MRLGIAPGDGAALPLKIGASPSSGFISLAHCGNNLSGEGRALLQKPLAAPSVAPAAPVSESAGRVATSCTEANSRIAVKPGMGQLTTGTG